MANHINAIAAQDPVCAVLVTNMVAVMQQLALDTMAGCADNVVKAQEAVSKSCEAAVAEGLCETELCPTCDAAGLCDASCGFCTPAPSPHPVFTPTPSPSTRPTLELLSTDANHPTLSPTKLISDAVNDYSTVMAVVELGAVLLIVGAALLWWFRYASPTKRAHDSLTSEARAMDFYSDEEDEDDDLDNGVEMNERARMGGCGRSSPQSGSRNAGRGSSSLKPFSDERGGGGGGHGRNVKKTTKSGHGALMQHDDDDDDEEADWSEEI
jgi:hypothetical protein